MKKKPAIVGRSGSANSSSQAIERSNSGSAGPSFLRKRLPIPKVGRKSVKKGGEQSSGEPTPPIQQQKQQQQQQQQQSQELDKINENVSLSSPTPSSPLSPLSPQPLAPQSPPALQYVAKAASPNSTANQEVEVVLSYTASPEKEADNAFLKALRGSNSMEDSDHEKDGAATTPSGFSNADNAFLSAFRGDPGGNASQPSTEPVTKASGFSNADNAFLSAIRRDSGGIVSKPTETATTSGGLNDADDAFLSAFRGESGGNAKKESSDNATDASAVLSDADNAFLNAFRGASANPTSTLTSSPRPSYPPKASVLSTADTDFLAGMRETPPPPSPLSSVESSPLYGRNNGKQLPNKAKPDMPSLPVILSSDSLEKPKDEMAHANAAFLGALHGGKNEVQGGNNLSQYTDGSFIIHSAPKTKQKGPRVQPPKQLAKPQNDSDSDFLMAVRGGQFPTSIEPSTYDSGTLVLNSPKPTSGAKMDAESSNSSFLMAIHASADEDDVKTTALTGRENGDASGVGKNMEPEEENDDDEEDMEGVKIPQQPYVEKVMLPRPLFFGHLLPPRIIEEAVHAASLYVKDASELENRETTIPIQSLPPNTPDAESSAADDSSTVSRSSSVSSLAAKGKIFHSLIDPCCRNLEGAIEAFGYGTNPFSSDDNEKEKDTTSDEPARPHSYVSIYSPVWDEWARAARVKARRKKAKLNSKAEAEAKAEEAKAKAKARRSPGRRHPKKSMSMDFAGSIGDSLSTFPHWTKNEHSQNDRQQSTVNTVDTAASSVSSISSTETPKISPNGADFSQDQFLQYARAGSADDAGPGTFIGSPKGRPEAKVEGNGTFVDQPLRRSFSGPSPMDSNTFVQAVKSSDDVSDDDSIQAAEERKAVGNDNLSAALAMLAGEGSNDEDGDENRGIGASMFMAAGGGAKAANKYGRPFSNFELMNGCVPQYGCDDPSLPHQSDLGIFDTKEEEKRNAELRRDSKSIEEFAVPGIMPHVKCPTQCSSVDDSVSWNSRVTSIELGSRSGSNTMLISLDGNTPSNPNKLSSGQNASQLYETSRCAWWNMPESSDDMTNRSSKGNRISKSNGKTFAAEVFPASDDPIPLDVQTNLWPPMSLLQENNMSGTRSHPATSTARFLPHLSDRPPSVRHLQIDTTAVGFPKLGGEIEPMFCKLAIYHFEMSPEKMAGSVARHDSDSVSTSASSHAPSPNMERCGRVTETLHFDIVQDAEVIQNCNNALWPYAKENGTQSEGTSCGMFPLPANLSISNLYAVIVVEKVISGKAELQPYYKPGRHESHDDIDLSKLRDAAKATCERYGHFTTPFAFGVVPLKHIIGDESPTSTVTRAVQIPLFKYDPERGPQSIFDHILLMLHPRAEPRGGKAASMTRGQAVLLMRYFGYLGLHSILKKKSSLARERLVDFTGELEVKYNSGKDGEHGNIKEKCPVLGETYTLPPWGNEYKVEPASFGGRNIMKPKGKTSVAEKVAPNSLYAQEIVSLPLERSVPESTSRGRNKTTSRTKYDGLVLHTSFCNELVCHPNLLQRCPQKNIFIKVELRELQWDENRNAEIAIPITPSIHNTRRGPWLVQKAFTSCAMGSPQFLDEFKIKLPLVLGEYGHDRIGILFTVFHFSKTKRRRLSMITNNGHKPEDGYSVENLGSGFLPLTLGNSPTCLIPNGDHEVPIKFRAVKLADSADGASPKTRHKKKFSLGSLGSLGSINLRSWSTDRDNDEIHSCKSGESKSDFDELSEAIPTQKIYPKGSLALTRLTEEVVQHADDDTQEDASVHSKSSRLTDEVASASGSSVRRGSSVGDFQQLLGAQKAESSHKDPSENEMLLHVNVIAFTSVHPQNKTLADLFLSKPKLPRSLMQSDFSEPYAPWGKYRSEITYRLKPERIPPFNFVGGALAETERKLLEPVVSLTKSSKCPHSDLMTHLVRVVAQLWRTTVSGAGEPSILWASPQSLIPLRLNAFATLLHSVSSAAHHMAKAGLRQLDGNSTWDITAVGKLLSMLFDEYAILGGPLENALNTKTSSPKKLPINKPSILSNRAKTVDKPSLTTRPNIVQRYSSEELSPPKVTPKKFFDVDAMLTPQLGNTSTDAVIDGDPGSELGDQPLTSGESGFKVDSKSDFMSALTASQDQDKDQEDEQDSTSLKSSSRNNQNLFKSGAHGPAANRRRWMTLPLNALATISENDFDENRAGGEGALGQKSMSSKNGDSNDTEIVLHPGVKTKPRQFRVPQVDANGVANSEANNDTDPFSSWLDSLDKKQDKEVNDPSAPPDKQRTLPTNDGEIETAGTAFLDAISKSMGFGQGLSSKEIGGEERRVGAAHHRKTRSRCSIDWSLPPTDTLLEKDQQMEQFNRARAGDTATTILPLSPIGSFPEDGSSGDDTSGNDDDSIADSEGLHDSDDGDGEARGKKDHPLKRHQRSISRDGSKPAEIIALPDYADRMSAMKNDGTEKRWWPYVYEVIIYQWVTLLEEQTKKGEKKSDGAKPDESRDMNMSGLSPIVVKYLSHAAKAARGATIRCAPFLLEIIKQSLSWRVDCVFRERKKKMPRLDETSCEGAVPPLIKLDENIMSAIEKLITMLTDASVDSRNFDSFEYRKISIDVNDAVVRFIRDLFSILDVQLAHRLVLVYFSRFVTKEGKHWTDRDSKVTGLRCSWETTKLRLNAVTLFVRFPEFMGTCLPIMESWNLPVGSTANSARRFFSDALEKISRLGLSEFTAPEGPASKEPIAIPRMKPHWLAELCTDICLSATGHAEESIQFRASSLIFELFWQLSQQGRCKGNISVVASVFVPFIPKVLSHIDYLSSLPAKGQLRKDILPCVLFVLQSAPVGLVRALWRKLAKRAEGKSLGRDSADKYGGIIGSGTGIGSNVALSSLLPLSQTSQINEDFAMDEEVDIFEVFGLLNLSLSTIEYEGSRNQVEDSNGAMSECDEKPIWRREFLISNQVKTITDPRSRPFKHYQQGNGVRESDSNGQLITLEPRRWHAHDSSCIIINICRQIVREILGMLKPNLGSTEDTHEGDYSYAGISGSRTMSDIFLQPTSSSLDDSESGSISGPQHEEGKAARLKKRLRKRKLETLAFAVTDTIIFVRAATSVYLHALSMKQSDVVITKTLTGAVEIVKIFGIKLFLCAIGETLQHWMRVILEHCGARRAELRVDACEFLNLLLRLTWDSYGSFSRIRLPLLAVQTEVMERIVAKAARNYVMEQRRLGLNPITLSNDSAEASLTPLWRTIDRLHNQSASQNLSFKSALARLAIKMKKVYRAYLAAHALAIVNRSESGSQSETVPSQLNPYVQRMRVSVHRIISNSTWLSKRFLGKDPSASLDRSMIQTEAVEDSFLIAADVFSSTELPSHRVAWLEKLAEFHRMRGRFAEEATCRCCIYHTYREAAKQHDHIWGSSPFLPWASSNSSDGTHPGGGGHAIVSDFDFETENSSGGSGKQIDRGAAFRRIFYRAADSVRVRSGDWGAVSGGKYLFFGVTLKSEFDSVSPWFSHREMEENMVEEAEIAGDLYLRAGIVESSRYAWSLANQFYSETFNYARLAYVYRRLALVVTSQVPIIDVSNQLDLSSQIGRFYKVYFHGSAPDDLLHSQGSEGFIYRAPNSVQIKDFASRLENAVRCILPNKTMIDLVLDDGSPTVTTKGAGGKRSNVVIGGAPIEPVKIKVTPLRPLFKMEDNEKCFRGTPEWFQLKAEENEFDVEADGSGRNSVGVTLLSLHHKRSHSTSTTNSLGSHGSLSMPARRSPFGSSHRKSSIANNNLSHDKGGVNGELIGVDKFYFTQPMKKDPSRGFRDWLKVPNSGMAERSLRVTELQVENSFPSCITRQKIIHRAVFTQSPLEASVEAVSTWCSVLFRTVIATNGQGVLGGQRQQGLSADSAKLVMECIHSSGVKRIGLTFLNIDPQLEDSNMGSGMYSPYESLSEEEIELVQMKLGRMIVTFLELLHLLIGRNRDVLLAVVQARKRRGGDAASVASGSIHGGYAATPRTRHSNTYGSPMKHQNSVSDHTYDRSSSEIHVGRSIIAESHQGPSSISGDRTDSAIGVQSELQRGFISLVKALSPNLLDTVNNEFPRWMRSCCQDNGYFSTGQYRFADIPIGDELFFNVDTSGDDERVSRESASYAVPRSIIRGSHTFAFREGSPSGSLGSGTSDRRIERTLSTTSERPPTDRSSHRRNISGTSYTSMKGV